MTHSPAKMATVGQPIPRPGSPETSQAKPPAKMSISQFPGKESRFRHHARAQSNRRIATAK